MRQREQTRSASAACGGSAVCSVLLGRRTSAASPPCTAEDMAQGSQREAAAGMCNHALDAARGATICASAEVIERAFSRSLNSNGAGEPKQIEAIYERSKVCKCNEFFMNKASILQIDWLARKINCFQ